MLLKGRISAGTITGVLLLSLCGVGWSAENARVLVHQMNPIYPVLCRNMHVTGEVVLLISIEPDGHVSDMRAQSGHPLLVQAAKDAVQQWRYKPSAARTQATVKVKFGL